MARFTIDEEAPVLVDFQVQPGAYEVALTPEDIARKSAEALDGAMNTINNLARRAIATADSLPRRPAQLELEFGIKLTAEAGLALLTKAGGEATMIVRLTLDKGENRLE